MPTVLAMLVAIIRRRKRKTRTRRSRGRKKKKKSTKKKKARLNSFIHFHQLPWINNCRLDQINTDLMPQTVWNIKGKKTRGPHVFCLCTWPNMESIKRLPRGRTLHNSTPSVMKGHPDWKLGLLHIKQLLSCQQGSLQGLMLRSELCR